MLDAVGSSNAAAWMDHFRLTAIDRDAQPAVAHLAPTITFAGGVKNVATGPRLQRVADTLTQLLGTPCRVEVADRPATATHETHPDSADASAQSRTVDRRDALDLPLVRDVFDVFPDATLLDARREETDDD
ncbi:MAG: hypothetical protein AAFX76_12460 [Planctomycetota bacterium]